jgi:hypothetical protein
VDTVQKNSNACRSLVPFAVIGALSFIVGCSGGSSTVNGTTTTTKTTTTTTTCSGLATSPTVNYRCLPGHTLTDPSDAAARAGDLVAGSARSMVNGAEGYLPTYETINAAGANIAFLVSQDQSYYYDPSLHISFKGHAADATGLSPEVIASDGHNTSCASIVLGDDGEPVVTPNFTCW